MTGSGARYFHASTGALNFDVLGQLQFNESTKQLLHPPVPPSRTAGHPVPAIYVGLSIPCYAAYKDGRGLDFDADFLPTSKPANGDHTGFHDAIAFDNITSINCTKCNSLTRLRRYRLSVNPHNAAAGLFSISGHPNLNDTRCQPYYVDAGDTDDSKIAIVGVMTSSKPAVIIHRAKAAGLNNRNLIRVNFSLPSLEDVTLTPQIPQAKKVGDGYFIPNKGLNLRKDKLDTDYCHYKGPIGSVNCVIQVNLDSAVNLGVTNWKVQLNLNGDGEQYYKNLDDFTTQMAVKGGIQIPSGGDLVKFLSDFDEGNPSSGYTMSGSSLLWNWAWGNNRDLGKGLSAAEKTIGIDVTVNVTALPSNTVVRIVPWPSYIARKQYTKPFPDSPDVDTGPGACQKSDSRPCLEVQGNLTFKPCDAGNDECLRKQATIFFTKGAA